MRSFISALIAVLCTIVISQTAPPQSCKCWDGYEPRNGTDGPECAGIFLRNVMPCNIVRLPECVCTGNVSRIIIEKEGPSCSTVKGGREIKRWSCENKEEWDQYDKQLAGSVFQKKAVSAN